MRDCLNSQGNPLPSLPHCLYLNTSPNVVTGLDGIIMQLLNVQLGQSNIVCREVCAASPPVKAGAFWKVLYSMLVY